MKMNIEKELNTNQLKAATNINNHTRIIAGAGSGKTRVLTYRIAYLINEVGIDASKILAITFTNKAANEMKERVVRLLGNDGLRTNISTIHSLCVKILREHIRFLGYPRFFVIIDTEDQKSILKDIYADLELDMKTYSYSSVLSYISSYKCAKITPSRAIELAGDFIGERNKARIYERYVLYLEKEMCLDFDDLLLKVEELFNDHQNVLEFWQSRFQYLHVDEFQDIGDIEYNIIQKLTGTNNILCVVGDPDQTIYSFRGANINYILDFNEDYKDVTTVYLNENYRSTKSILNTANTLIRHNKKRLEKELFTNLDDGHQIIHYSGKDAEDEARYVVNEIDKIIESIEGVNYADFLVLYRANYLSRTIEQALMKNRIDYRIFGGVRFTDRKEVKDVLSYLRVFVYKDDLAFNRIINTPGRGVGKKSIEKIRAYGIQNNMPLYYVLKNHLNEIGLTAKVKRNLTTLILMFEALNEKTNTNDLNLVDIIDELIHESGYIEMLKLEDETTRLENVMEIKNMASSFLNDYVGENAVEEFLQELPISQGNNDYIKDEEQFVSLMTIHMSKGLEYRYVFVVGLSDDVFPSFRSISESGDDGLEEERRLAYVAFTRAKERLYLCDSKGYSFVTNGPKLTSRFIDEIGKDNVVFKGQRSQFKTSDYVVTKSILEDSINEELNDIKAGDLVIHQMFGKGVVIKIDNHFADIAFELPHGIKTLIKNHKALKKL